MVTPYATIGQPVGRAEGPEKVTGKAVYPADINLPGTLMGKCPPVNYLNPLKSPLREDF